MSSIHGDHLKKSTIKKIAYEKPNIKFIIGHKLVPTLVELGVIKKNILCLDLGKWYDLGLFKAKIDYLIHDVPNCCLNIETKDNKKLFYAVDTSSLEHIIAKDYDLYLVEANYEDEKELDQKIIESNKKNEFNYLRRVKETHLSQLKAINWLDKNMGANSEYVFIHQHKDK